MQILSLMSDLGVDESTLSLILNRLLPKVQITPWTSDADLSKYGALVLFGRLPVDNELYHRVKEAKLQLIAFYVTNTMEQLEKIDLYLFDRLFFADKVRLKDIQSLSLINVDSVPHPAHLLDGRIERLPEVSAIGLVYFASNLELVERVRKGLDSSEEIILIPIQRIDTPSILMMARVKVAFTLDAISSRLATICHVPFVRLLEPHKHSSSNEHRRFQLNDDTGIDKAALGLLLSWLLQSYSKITDYLSVFQERSQNILGSGKLLASLNRTANNSFDDGHTLIGWPSAMKLLRLQFPDIIIVGDVGTHFNQLNRNDLPYTMPWIGFIHGEMLDIWHNPEFLISLYSCTALFTPFSKLTSSIRGILKKAHVKVSVLTFRYPLPSVPRFNLNSFLKNSSRGFVQPLMNRQRPYLFQSIYSPFIKKKAANQSIPRLEMKVSSKIDPLSNANDIGEILIYERLIKDYTLIDETLHVIPLTSSVESRIQAMLTSVEPLTDPNLDYLTDHLIFVDGDDENVGDVILLCIASGTPVVTTESKLSQSLLGKKYPFSFNEPEVYGSFLMIRSDRLSQAIESISSRSDFIGSLDDLSDAIKILTK